MEVKLQERSAKYVKFLEKESGAVDQDYLNYLDQQYCEGLTELGYDFPHMFRVSFFTQIISFIEFELKELCLAHEVKNSSLFKFSELQQKNELDKVKLYLKNSEKIDFSLLDPEWGYLKKMKILRNRFVHHYGTIDKADYLTYKTVFQFVNNEKSLSFREIAVRKGKLEDFNSLTIIIIDKEFNINLLNQAEKLFRKILTLLQF